MEIIQSKYNGFCFGVSNAINLVENITEINKQTNKKVYTYGPLIHNIDVTESLKERGVESIDNLDNIEKGSILIIRSHGVPEKFYADAIERELEIFDATCKFVSRIHSLVSDAYKSGLQIAIVGDPKHPEVIGINGWCGDSAIIIENIEDTKKISSKKLFLVGQTTITNELWDEIKKELEKNEIEIIENNTICNATINRQEECKRIAQNVDAMVIIGSHESSNTKKLFTIAQKYCKNTYFVERKENLPLKELQFCSKIGVATGASTPERIIEEVIATMSEFITEPNEEFEEENQMQAMMEEIEKSLRLPGRGEIIKGEVIQVNNREVVVNLGCKKDGILTKDEIFLEAGQELTDLFKAGDMIEAKVLKTDDGDGNISLSKKKLEVNEHWDEINNAVEDRSFINAKVIKEVKGGVIAVYKEVFGFIPMAQLSDRFIEKADEFIGKVLPVRVTRVDQKRNKAVFSHKAFLNEERSKKVAEIWDSIAVGDIVEGTVMRFTEYGAFVDIGGLDGLLHISEISWGKLKHPQEILKIGEKVQAKILSINSEKGKISLGLKQNTPEPWSKIDDAYKVGDVVSGKVVQIKEYGGFVELQPGLDGLVHISEIAHKRVSNIANELHVGQMVQAKILEIDKEKKRISLSIKETLEPPTPEELEAQREAQRNVTIPDEYEEKSKAEVVEDEEGMVKDGVVEADINVEAEAKSLEEYEEAPEDKDLSKVMCEYDPKCEEGEDVQAEDAHDTDVTEPSEVDAEVDVLDRDVVLDTVLK
jgi:ribosomal protein S1/(E)-4-hydroxy-3-methyl-but-2-enyl pyrophosphate reductase